MLEVTYPLLLTLCTVIAQEDPTLISTTAPRAILVTSRRVCVPSEPVMTHTNKRVVALSN